MGINISDKEIPHSGEVWPTKYCGNVTTDGYINNQKFVYSWYGPL